MDLSKIYLYRITHIENLEDILSLGKICCPSHNQASKSYKSIGDITLIEQRKSMIISEGPSKDIQDYVSFYFCPKTPMLYRIQHGYNVKKFRADDIVFFVTTVDIIKRNNCKYIFTDGHAFANYTRFFSDDRYFQDIDWKVIKDQFWFNTESDNDKKRRKQAEFLVFLEVPINSVLGIAVYNDDVKHNIEKLINKNIITGLEIKVKKDYYY